MNEEKALINLSSEQISRLKLEAVRDRAYAVRISIVLAIRLLDRSNPYFDKFAVLDELDYLEGVRSTTRTKSEAFFKQDLSVILCAGHIMRTKDHGYADEEERSSRITPLPLSNNSP